MPETIDRISPTLRPNQPQVMWQTWEHLLFLHWKVPVEMLRPLIPSTLEIDTFQGDAYVGLVPFTMKHIRPMWFCSVPWLSFFHETNVRTYVHFQGQQPGVWFFSLEAANPVAVYLARSLWRLPYFHAKMSMKQRLDDGKLWIDYETRRYATDSPSAYCKVSYAPSSDVFHAESGTLEHFLAERYLLYASKDGTLYRGQVYHTPYPLQVAEFTGLEQTLTAAIQIDLPNQPMLAHYVAGVMVRIYPLQRVE